MQTANDLKMNIISILSRINDLNLLRSINSSVEKISEQAPGKENTLPFERGVTTIRKNLTADDIFAEQGNKSITFEEITEITKDIEWEHSLEDMLAALD
jgi:hypothetical protein